MPKIFSPESRLKAVGRKLAREINSTVISSDGREARPQQVADYYGSIRVGFINKDHPANKLFNSKLIYSRKDLLHLEFASKNKFKNISPFTLF